MADIPGIISKINDIEVQFDASISEQLFNKIGANINQLIEPSINVVEFTASGNYTKPANLRFAYVFVVGGGGGSGGVFNGSSNLAHAGGGGGGGAAFRYLRNDQLSVSETVTIGAAGTAGTSAPTSGGAGGTTSFGSLVLASGGSGSASVTGTSTGDRYGSSGAAGVGTTGNLLYYGTPGLNGFGGSHGGNSGMGFGAGGRVSSTITDSLGIVLYVAAVGVGFGSGGAGGATRGLGIGSTNTAGAAGKSGYCLVLEIT